MQGVRSVGAHNDEYFDEACKSDDVESPRGKGVLPVLRE